MLSSALELGEPGSKNHPAPLRHHCAKRLFFIRFRELHPSPSIDRHTLQQLLVPVLHHADHTRRVRFDRLADNKALAVGRDIIITAAPLAQTAFVEGQSPKKPTSPRFGRGKEDFQLCLGIQGPPASGEGLAAKIEGFKGTVDRAKEAFPNASVFATTLHEVVNTNSLLWSAIMVEGDNWHVVWQPQITVLERIVGGDQLIGGVLYPMLGGWEPEKRVQFGWVTDVLAATLYTD